MHAPFTNPNTENQKNKKKNLLLAPPNPIVQNKKSSLLVSIFIQTLKARLRSHAHERIHGSADRRTFPSDSPQRVACRRKRAQALPTCGTNLVPPSRASRLTPPQSSAIYLFLPLIAREFTHGLLTSGVLSSNLITYHEKDQVLRNGSSICCSAVWRNVATAWRRSAGDISAHAGQVASAIHWLVASEVYICYPSVVLYGYNDVSSLYCFDCYHLKSPLQICLLSIHLNIQPAI